MTRPIKPTPVQISVDLNYALSMKRHARRPDTGSEPLELVLIRSEAMTLLHSLAGQLGLIVSPPVQLDLPLYESTSQ